MSHKELLILDSPFYNELVFQWAVFNKVYLRDKYPMTFDSFLFMLLQRGHVQLEEDLNLQRKLRK